ncbi:MAG TPA: hypothetical protein VFM96_08170 [Gaiellaceae bacterium]|nr:hypothetical protein [Gaiellaceae bacterium]
MRRSSAKLGLVVVGVACAAALIAYYIASYLVVRPPAVAASGEAPRARITLQTVASIGFGPHHDWVSYLAQNPRGTWEHSTVLTVPAHSLIRVTIYQYDTATGLRNAYWGGPRGLVGGMRINGKLVPTLDPNLASHTFAIPDLGVSVPLQGVASNAKNQCSVAPCTLAQAHNTITFTFRTGKGGTFRWQCFVPCGAGFIFGFGGPMQSIGYMDGYLHVVA